MMTEEELNAFRKNIALNESSTVWLEKKMLSHIDEQASQIATLKTALEKDRFWLCWQTGKYNSIVAATRAAITQLAKEYPEINWEE